jgi:hypothetical protein
LSDARWLALLGRYWWPVDGHESTVPQFAPTEKWHSLRLLRASHLNATIKTSGRHPMTRNSDEEIADMRQENRG